MEYKSGTADGGTHADARGGLRGLLREYRQLAGLALNAAGGFIMANASILGEISPFGVAFCAALPGGASVAAALGAGFGYALAPGAGDSMRYIAAVVLTAAARWLLAPKRAALLGKSAAAPERKETVIPAPVASMMTAFFAMLVAGAAAAFSSGYTVYDLVLNISEIMLTCGAAYFFSRSLLPLKLGLSGAGKTDVSCAVVSVAILIAGFSGLMIQGVSVGHVLAAAAVLFAARAGGEAGGSIAGAIAGLSVSLAGGELGYAAAAYAFGGLVSGVFSPAGRIASAGAFVVVNAVIAFLSLEPAAQRFAMIEVCAASVIFAAAPGSVLRAFQAPGARTGLSIDDGYVRGLLRDRLDDVSQALSEVGHTTRKVSEGLSRLAGDGSAEAAARTVERVCRKCQMKNTCWQFSHSETMAALNLALSTIKRTGGVSRSRAPKYLTENCTKLGELLGELTLQSREQGARGGAERKISLVRSVITDQFEALSQILAEISGEIYAFKAFNEAASKRVRDYLEREGFAPTRVRVYTDDKDRLCVSFMLPHYQVARFSKTKTALDLCGLLDADLDMPQITARARVAAVTFFEKTCYAVNIGAYQLAEGQNRLCGDSYDFIENKDGKAHFILSDGMGSGGGAAVDSGMASELVRQLLAAGISHGTALKLANSALMVKSGSESLATVDVATVDLFSGQADFYKAGAAPTFIVKNGKAGSVETNSMPAGILRGVSFEHSLVSLAAGDIVIMVSDGVTATGSEWVKTELASLQGEDVQELCEKLAKAAKAKRSDNHEDDITVVAARVVARE